MESHFDSAPEFHSRLNGLLARVREITGQVAVVLVANVAERKTLASSEIASVYETEYFSEGELDQIIGALREFGFYVHTYLSEDSFIHDVLSGDFDKIPRPLKLVHNSAQTGIGPGRKSLVPAFCNLHAIPTTNSDAYVVGLGRHKMHVNLILGRLGLPTPRTWFYDATDRWLLSSQPHDVDKLLLKLCYESASIGLDETCLVSSGEEAEALAHNLSTQYSQPVLAQELIPGFEVEAPVIELAEPVVPDLIGISLNEQTRLGEKILSFETIRDDSYSFYGATDTLPARVISGLKKAAVAAYEALGIFGIGRIDFRVTEDGHFFIIDTSTNPHLIRHSSFARAFANMGRPYSDLLGTVAALGCRRAGWIA